LKPINDQLKVFLAEGGRVIACGMCRTNAGLKPDDMSPGVEIDHMPAMAKLQKIIDQPGLVTLDY
jgi:hypothetical protein